MDGDDSIVIDSDVIDVDVEGVCCCCRDG